MKTPMQLAIGQLLLWSGFLGGAYAAVLRLEDADAPWRTIPWNGYALATFVGIIGIILIRRARANQRQQSAESETGIESLLENLAAAADKVSDIAARLDQLTCEEVLDSIDSECVPLLAEFADGRMAISHRFGTGAYASVMTEFASGERYLNRAWSAAADGYVDEVSASIGHSKSFFRAALDELRQAESAGTLPPTRGG